MYSTIALREGKNDIVKTVCYLFVEITNKQKSKLEILNKYFEKNIYTAYIKWNWYAVYIKSINCKFLLYQRIWFIDIKPVIKKF